MSEKELHPIAQYFDDLDKKDFDKLFQVFLDILASDKNKSTD